MIEEIVHYYHLIKKSIILIRKAKEDEFYFLNYQLIYQYIVVQVLVKIHDMNLLVLLQLFLVNVVDVYNQIIIKD